MKIFSQWRAVARRWVPALPGAFAGTIPAAFSVRLHVWRCRGRRDLGIGPADAWREASKGFWQC